MKQENKSLLLRDLSARLPYGVMIEGLEHPEVMTIKHLAIISVMSAEPYKPYLRPMSSMTEDEKRDIQIYYPGGFGNQWLDVEKGKIEIFECSSTMTLYLNDAQRIVDWLNKKMFDYRGLIEKGLALEAPKDMYK